MGCKTVSRWLKGSPHRPLSLSPKTHWWITSFFPLNLLWCLFLIMFCLNLKVLQSIVKVSENHPGDLMLDAFVRLRCVLTACRSIVCTYVVILCVLKWQLSSNRCYPFQKVVRHIFIHANIIFYIWIVDLFNELQYIAMYFYIVSSFLFKDRLFYFIWWEPLYGKTHRVPQSSTQVLHTSQIDPVCLMFF